MRLFNIIFFILLTFALNSQMSVIDPQNWCGEGEAGVDNIEIEVRPAGTFAEVAFSWDLMAVDWWDNYDGLQLEYIHDFNLDPKAVVNDSWLWIENYISVGDIYERSEGTAIYESIVDRRQDPSILTKTSSSNYHFRVYPLMADSTRRVRISYLIPMDFSGDSPQVDVPFASFFNGSAQIPSSVSIEVHDDLNWFHEEVVGPLSISQSGLNSTTYTYDTGGVPQDLSIVYRSDVPDSELHFGTYDSFDSGNYFQMVYKPEIPVVAPPSYNLILLDYDENNCVGFSPAEVLESVKDELFKLNDTDYFNIIYSDWVPKLAAASWLACTDDNIQQVFSNIDPESLDVFSNMDAMLPEALVFLDGQAVDAHLVVLNASTHISSEFETNQFLERLSGFISEMDSKVTIDAIDYTNANRRRRWVDNVEYFGSGYFLTRLTQLNSGNFYSDGTPFSFSHTLGQTLFHRSLFLQEFNLSLDSQDGFVFGEFGSNNNFGLDISQPILLTGKYYGEYPFTLDFDYVIDGQLFSESILIPEEGTLSLDNKAEDVWLAQLLLENEFSGDPIVKQQVIETSIENRLLSYPTIYLCLEPDTTAISSNNSSNETEVFVKTEEEIIASELSVYPNPFATEINLEMPSTYSKGSNSILVSLLNVQGELITDLSEFVIIEKDTLSLKWVDTLGLDPGMYIIRITNGDVTVSKKIIKIAF